MQTSLGPLKTFQLLLVNMTWETQKVEHWNVTKGRTSKDVSQKYNQGTGVAVGSRQETLGLGFNSLPMLVGYNSMSFGFY